MFSFPTHMQPKSQHERVDPEERRQRSMNCLLMGTEAVSKGKVRKTNKGKKEWKTSGKATTFGRNCMFEHHGFISREWNKPAPYDPPPNDPAWPNDPPPNDTAPNDASSNDPAPNDAPSLFEKCIQTDLTCKDVVYLEAAKAKLENKPELKREMFIDDVHKFNKSVHFYTGLSSHACLMMLFSFLKPLANAMKYWDNRKKRQRET